MVNEGHLTTLGKVLSGLVIGIIFWSGVFYQRVAGIEATLIKIETQLPALGKVAVLEERTAEQASAIRELRLEIEQMRELKN